MEGEIARIRRQIAEQYEAAQRGVSGLAQGTSQHGFITEKMERMGQLHSQLQSIVGDEEAIRMVAQTIEEL